MAHFPWTVGYTTDKEHNYHIDPLTAPFVLEAYQNYDEGMTMSEIAVILNQKEFKNTRGGRISIENVASLLKNRRYTGEYIYRYIVVPDGIQSIVPKDLFERVQEKIAKNKKAPHIIKRKTIIFSQQMWFTQMDKEN